MYTSLYEALKIVSNRKGVVLVKKSILLMTLVIIAIIASASVTQAATLKAGSTGSEIIMLQSELQSLNYDVGPVDGIFGSKTKAAVQAFQRDNNLLVDGIVGPQTQEALKKATISNSDVSNASILKANTSPQEKTNQIISTAKSFLGVPYKWGGTTPSGFDCSGFTRYVFASQNISLPRVSIDQYAVGTPVAFNNLIPGDLVFFNLVSGKQVSHVGIYIGDNQFISATSSKGIAIYSFTPYWANAYVGAKRIY
ncbi:Cell wall-associated hydrolase, NlpC family [Desulfosporosinus lacus DSM 15449]|uniref:Cell wall-associated hydrolase, NlpC family n=2 Tax=Desulfosporosinus TaxID=79206 RepID=A0A1M6BU06_9FIRM|nr:Cell wall-associated hydrolase, NlpC family [Desulfosporosinus lacus DSM 15449]